MENAVVSDHLKVLLADRLVKAAVFTTYNFEPDFFELEVVPLLLPGNIQLSSHATIKLFQVREALRESAVELEVFYDLKIFRENASCSPSMEYPFHGVYRGNNAFHPKLVFILVYDEKAKNDCLLVGAGSNNLTQAGWWDNIEGVHWEMVWPRSTASGFVKRLRADIEWLQTERYLVSDDGHSALDLVADYLDLCLDNAGTPGTEMTVPYYGIVNSSEYRGFQQFLENEARQKLATYNNWTLEIISPYFAENDHNNLHELFFDLGVRHIHLLLPNNQEGVPLCTSEYFNYIDEQPNVHWADWSEPAGRSLGLTGQHFRRLHAKLYHFYNKMQSWAFVGSVNFTYKAFTENIEAGYFVKLPKAGPLLKLIKDTKSFDHFEPPSEPAPGDEKNISSETAPVIDLVYDWRLRTLTGVTESHKSYRINIHMPERELAVADWALTGEPCKYEGELDSLETLLKNGSLIKISGVNQRSNKDFEAHWLMLKQTGWTHKPLDLPKISPEQILAIYAGMSPDKRQALLMNAHIRKLVLSGQGGDMTSPKDDFVADEFFSEYAELFHAFRQLQRKLSEAQDDNNQALVQYYLTGAGFDSLPTLLENIEKYNETRSVTAYLILLCAKEVYHEEQFSDCFGVPERLEKVDAAIATLKETSAIRLEKTSPEDRVRFFTWFEAQFFKTYRQREVMK